MGLVMTEKDMQNALTRYWSSAELAVPNIDMACEIDLAILSRAGYLYDIEIKRSRGDWVADFRKFKWEKQDCPGEAMSQQEHWSRIRRFYFAVTEGMEKDIPPCVPDWTGILVVKGDDAWAKIEEFRPAANRKCRKLDIKEVAHMGKVLHYRYWASRRTWPAIEDVTDKMRKPEYIAAKYESIDPTDEDQPATTSVAAVRNLSETLETPETKLVS